MGIFDLFKIGSNRTKEVETTVNTPPIQKVQESGAYISSYSIPATWDGEKTIGNVGPIKQYTILYDRLRERSWQMYLDAEIGRKVLNKYILWIVKNGLRAQSSPQKEIIGSYRGIPDTFKTEVFARNIENRFSIWANDKLSTYNGEQSFNQYQTEIYKNAIVGGDVLIILRKTDGIVNVQAIDGKHLKCGNTRKLDNGNKLINGIEFDKKGKVVRYHVTIGTEIVHVEEYEEKTGLRVAWLQYGTRHRLDNQRGIPIIATAIESIAKTDRYKEATIDQAEEIRKLAYVVTHGTGSTGENPISETVGEMFGVELEDQNIKRFESGEKVANNIAVSTGRKVQNMPIDSDIKSLDAKNELYFKDFYTILADSVASTIMMPPDVANSQYNNSFSASRAATKDWENTIDFSRTDFDNQTLGYVYEYWLYYEVWEGRIYAPGLISAYERKDIYLKGSYIKHRFIGPKFPHIDPVKEVTAARLKLGTAAAHLPLANADDESEVLMSGDFDTNVERLSRELQEAERLGIKPKESSIPTETESENEGDS